MIKLGWLLILSLTQVLWSGPIIIGGVPGLDASLFRVTTFATGIPYAYGMTRLNDGGLLVGSSPGFQTRVLRFTDANGDGVADGPGVPVISGPGGIVTAIQQVGPYVAVGLTSGNNNASVLFYAPGATPNAPYTPVGALQLTSSVFWEHNTPGLSVVPTVGQPGHFDLYVNIGSQNNNSPSTTPIAVSGLVSGNIQADSIYRFPIDTTGGSLTSTTPTRVVSGIRNSVAMGFRPSTGDFYFADNGINGLVDGNIPLSVDTLNRINPAQLFGPTLDYGFSANYTEYRTGNVIGTLTNPPLIAFQPLGNPQTGSRSEGPSGLAFSPSNFPSPLANGIFVGFHGRQDSVGLANDENPLVFVDLSTNNYFHFIDNNDPNVGHIDSLFSTADSLFLADFASTNGGDSGIVYQISMVPEPGTFALSFTALGMLWLYRRRS